MNHTCVVVTVHALVPRGVVVGGCGLDQFLQLGGKVVDQVVMADGRGAGQAGKGQQAHRAVGGGEHLVQQLAVEAWGRCLFPVAWRIRPGHLGTFEFGGLFTVIWPHGCYWPDDSRCTSY